MNKPLESRIHEEEDDDSSSSSSSENESLLLNKSQVRPSPIENNDAVRNRASI